MIISLSPSNKTISETLEAPSRRLRAGVLVVSTWSSSWTKTGALDLRLDQMELETG